VGDVLVELFAHGTVHPNHLDQAKAATIYAAFLDTPSPPKVEFRWPFDWHLVWRRLWASNLPPP
jgi:hypothetical protein